MLFSIALFIIGFVILIKGADALIDGASSLAHRLGLSDFIVGLTVVAFGTSLPEMVVNLFANGGGQGELAIGNIVGSNIANILLILGVCAIITPLTLRRITVYREVVFAMGAAMILAVMVSDGKLTNGGFPGLDMIDGILLLVFFFLFIYYTFGHRTINEEIELSEDELSVGKASFLVLVGTLFLAVGGNWIVRGTSDIALGLGISQSIIGLTIVALGTSAPELAASVSAVRSKKIDIAVGNVLGSNLFNTFWVLGLNAVINPIAFSQDSFGDVLMGVIAALTLFGMMFVGHRHSIHRRAGMVMIAIYAGYLGLLVLREVNIL